MRITSCDEDEDDDEGEEEEEDGDEDEDEDDVPHVTLVKAAERTRLPAVNNDVLTLVATISWPFHHHQD